jgi:tetratricopeptide (TPR) repeat protein/lysophospholipase L1-like esterase
MEMPQGKKRAAFYGSLVLIPFVVVALLEAGLRVCSYGDDLSLFVPSSDPQYLTLNHVVGKRYFGEHGFTTPLPENILKDKPANGFRIFVLGESTVIGFPYDANIAFTRILQRRLQDIFPHRTIEVCNLGMTAINSYTLLDIAVEVVKQKPDVVLIYTGHNEYYGALGAASMKSGAVPAWVKYVQLKLIHLRLYQLLDRTFEQIASAVHPKSEQELKGTLMQQMVGRNIVPTTSAVYAEGLTQFHDNMSGVLKILTDAHIPVIMSDLVSNVKDVPPFYSAQDGQLPPAYAVYHAAQQSEHDSRFDQAKAEYLRAKDLDEIRFRAPEAINTMIADLAATYGISTISLKTVFENNSPHGIVGNSLMSEHLHPTVDGYFLMSEGFLDAMRDHRMIEPEWDTSRIRPWTYYRNNWGFTELDSMIAIIRIKHLKAGWPFQPDTTTNNFFYTYQPVGIVDSLAFLRVKYDNVSSEVVHKKMAAYFESQGDLLRASKEYLAIAYTSPTSVSSFYYASDLAAKAGAYEVAIRYISESPHADTSLYAQFSLASFYTTQKKYAEVVGCVDAYLRTSPDKHNGVKMEKLKYAALNEMGRKDEAAECLESIKRTDPSFTGGAGEKKLIVLIPEKIKPYLEKADVLMRKGQPAEALAVLREANSVHEIAYTNLLIGKILFSQRDLESLKYFEKAHREIKDDPSLISSLCILYTMKKEFTKANAALNEFVRLEGAENPRSQQLKALYEKQANNVR